MIANMTLENTSTVHYMQITGQLHGEKVTYILAPREKKTVTVDSFNAEAAIATTVLDTEMRPLKIETILENHRMISVSSEAVLREK